MAECKDCKRYKGNCGLHFVDWNNHINYEIPCEGADCFEPSQEFLKKQFEKRVREILEQYPAEAIEEAMAILKETEVEK